MLDATADLQAQSWIMVGGGFIVFKLICFGEPIVKLGMGFQSIG